MQKWEGLEVTEHNIRQVQVRTTNFLLNTFSQLIIQVRCAARVRTAPHASRFAGMGVLHRKEV